MTGKQIPSNSKRLFLDDHTGLGRVHVDIEAFFEFSFWLAEELEDLVGLWSQRLPRNIGRARRRATLEPEQREELGG